MVKGSWQNLKEKQIQSHNFHSSRKWEPALFAIDFIHTKEVNLIDKKIVVDCRGIITTFDFSDVAEHGTKYWEEPDK